MSKKRVMHTLWLSWDVDEDPLAWRHCPEWDGKEYLGCWLPNDIGEVLLPLVLAGMPPMQIGELRQVWVKGIRSGTRRWR